MKRITGILFLILSVQCSQQNAIQTNKEHEHTKLIALLEQKPLPLKSLTKAAVAASDKISLCILLGMGARPPLFDAASKGNQEIVALITKRFSEGKERGVWQIGRKEQNKILKR